MKQFLAPVVSCEEVMSGIHLLWIDGSSMISPNPGQFVTIRCGEDTLLRRPLSIHRVADHKFALLFASVGPGTEWLTKRKTGDSLDILGPLGNGFRVFHETRNILLAGGGIGIAPLIYLAQTAVSSGCSVRLVCGAQTSSQLYSGRVEGVEILRITDDGSAGEKGLVTDVMMPLAEWADQIFACGPMPMYRSMSEMSESFSGKTVQVLLEKVMACGVSACRGCAVSTNNGIKMVCQDGPVFDLKNIIWE